MGHACTKEKNADKVERRRIEREARLGLRLKKYSSNDDSRFLNRNDQVSTFPRTPRTELPGSQGEQSHQLQYARSTPQDNFRRTENRPGRSSTPTGRSEIRAAVRPLSVTRVTNGPKPVVVQALNSLCALELQYRVYIVNEESQEHAELVALVERLRELEAIFTAIEELLSLQRRSRSSIHQQEEAERQTLTQWIASSLEEERLAFLIRQTQNRQAGSLPSSRRSSPQRFRSRDTATAATPYGSTPHRFDTRASLQQPYSSPQRWTEEIPVQRLEPVVAESRHMNDDYARVSALAKNRYQSDERLSEEEALEAKIARQRHLIASTKAMFGSGQRVITPQALSPVRHQATHFDYRGGRTGKVSPERVPLRAPPTAPSYPLNSFSEAPYVTSERRSGSTAREASYEATRNRLSALSYYH